MSAQNTKEPTIDRLGRDTFIQLFLAARRLTDEVEEVCKQNGLTMSHYTVLWVVCLSESTKGIPMRAVVDGLMTRASDATRLVDRLARDGFVERTNSPKDRRVVLIRATRSGRSLFLRTTAAVKELHRSQWSSLTITELRELHGLLTKTLWGDSVPESHPLQSLPPQ